MTRNAAGRLSAIVTTHQKPPAHTNATNIGSRRKSRGKLATSASALGKYATQNSLTPGRERHEIASKKIGTTNNRTINARPVTAFHSRASESNTTPKPG